MLILKDLKVQKVKKKKKKKRKREREQILWNFELVVLATTKSFTFDFSIQIKKRICQSSFLSLSIKLKYYYYKDIKVNLVFIFRILRIQNQEVWVMTFAFLISFIFFKLFFPVPLMRNKRASIRDDYLPISLVFSTQEIFPVSILIPLKNYNVKHFAFIFAAIFELCSFHCYSWKFTFLWPSTKHFLRRSKFNLLMRTWWTFMQNMGFVNGMFFLFDIWLLFKIF